MEQPRPVRHHMPAHGVAPALPGLDGGTLPVRSSARRARHPRRDDDRSPYVPGRVHIVAWFFEASSALGLLLLVGLATANLLAADWMRSHGAPALTIPQLLAASGGLIAGYWVGRLPARGERAGALGVLLAFAGTLVRWLTGDTSDLLAVGLGAVAAVAVLTSWRALD